MPEIRDHYRPTRGDYAPGVYRVVGTSDGVALLRVTDGDGRRVNSGDLAVVSPDELDAAFEPADDPDAGFNPVAAVRNSLQGLYWQFRKFL